MEYKNYLSWYELYNIWDIRKFMEDNGLLYEVSVYVEDAPGFETVGEFTEGKWSSYMFPVTAKGKGIKYFYFFELETDAMAFKLRCY